jgi:hypothetical protein
VILQISQQINDKIKELETLKEQLKFTAIKEAEYSLALAKVMLRLKSEGMPITLIKEVGKGECWKEQMEKDTEKASYDITKEKVDIVKAQLNGYQTIHKHLEEI